MLKSNEKNCEIEFWRFVFSSIILLHHAIYLPKYEGGLFGDGSCAVEFFFIVSGYLLMASVTKANKSIDDKSISIMEDTKDFMIRKIKSFYPEVFIAGTWALMLTIVTNTEKMKDLLYRLLGGIINDVFLLRMTGVYEYTGVNAVVWYISTLLICSLIYYPLLRKYPKRMTNVIIPLLSFFIIGYFMQTGDLSVRNPDAWAVFTYRGNFRGFAEIGLGIILFEVVQALKCFRFNKKGKLLLTLVKWGAYCTTITWMIVSRGRGELLCIILFCVAIAITFSEQSMDSCMYNNKMILWLGKFSFPLYLSHIIYANRLVNLVPTSWDFSMLLVCYLICSIMTAVVVMFVSDHIRSHKVCFKIVGLIINT